MKRFLKWAGLALVVLFVAAQFYRPEKTNPPVDASQSIEAHAQMTPEVEAILKRSCYDCHSNETRWPWYTNVAPSSWFVIDHVNEARRHLNFSDWMKVKRRTNKPDPEGQLEEITEQVEEGEMPLESYLLLHPDAKLSDQDKKVLTDWAKAEKERLASLSKE